MHTHFLRHRLGRWLAVTLLALLSATSAHAQLTGAKAIPGDYTSVAAAITALNAGGVGAGGVTFNIAAGYTETFASPTAGAITATGTAANPIVFQRAGTGARPVITAGVGTSTSFDAIISLAGSDYVTFDGLELAENAANTTATTQMEFGFALFRPSPTDGCQNNIIRNCVVTLNKTNTGTFGIYGAASAPASSTSVAASAPSGAHSNNKVDGNIITNTATGMYFTASTSTTQANYDTSNEIGVITPNQVYNFGTTATGWGIGGNYQSAFKVVNNVVNNTLNYAGGTTSAVAASTVTSTLRGIYGNACPSANIDITGNTVTLASGGTTSLMTGIDNGIGSTPASNTVNITGNTVTMTYATATTATITGITNSGGAATVNITGNTVQNSTAAAATTAPFLGITSSAGSAINLNNNTVSNNVIAGTGTMTLISSSLVAAASPVSISNNTITNNSKTPTGTSSSATLLGITLGSALTTITGNTITNNSIVTAGSSTTAGTLVGINSSASSTTSENLSNNVVTGLSISGTSTATTHVLRGILTASNGSSDVQTLNQNTIGGLAIASGSGTVTGISVPNGGGTGSLLSRNKIYDLSATGAAGSVTGLLISAGGTYAVANNLIGDLRAPAATGLLAVTGLNVAGGTAVNAYFNTLYLNASSTGATFGTSGVYLNSTTTTLDLRNNIVVNTSTAAGTGGYTVAFRRTSGTAGTVPSNYATTSNNNLFYAGTPSATNLIYVEGTTTATNAQQTLAAYKAFMVNRDQQAVTENPPFASTTGTASNFLHIATGTATQVESAALPISGFTTDFDGDTRNASTPDIGADEGAFTPLDLTGPVITLTPLTATASTANRTLVATISDPSGVSTTTAPRLFYRKGTSGTFTSALATSTSGSSYTFTLDYAALGGVTAGDVIQYYVVAQDVPGNVSSNPSGGTYSTNPGSVYQYTILQGLSGVYYVGTSTSPNPARTYATLTAAANAYSTSGLTGAVTFLLLDNAYSAATGETFPVAFFNNPDASATNSLLIKPNTGATPVVTAAGSVLVLASTRYVTIDGSNTANGTTRDLTLTNTTQTASTYSLGLLSQTGQAQANQFATIRNVNAVGGGATTNATVGIAIGGADNDNVTLQNNSVQGVTTGIQAFGSTNTSAGGLDNLLITGNVVGPTTAAAGANINQYGIVVASALSPVVSRNEVQNIVNPTASFSANMTGILMQDVQTGVVTRNTVHNLNYNGTSTAKLYGISTQVSTSSFNTAATPSAIRFDNNLVYALNSTATSASWNTSGINNNGGYGDQYYYNTVYLSGQLSTGTAGSAAFSNGNGITSTAAANIDVRNNIFSIIGGTGVASTPLYAHYTTLTSYTGSTLNYNDLYVTVGGTNGVARIGRINGTDATTLADWRTATGQEANSVSADPAFVQVSTTPYDLHPSATAINNVATPIAAVTVDYTGAARGTTPDIGAYEFTPATNDLKPAALVGPSATGCYGAAEPVIVQVQNNGTSVLNFATAPATVTVVVTLPGGTTQTFTTTLSTGTLAGGATQNITLPGTLNMTAVGTYSFAITGTVQGDGNTANDNLTATRTVVGVATQPQLVTFTGFTGSNLSTAFPGWTEASGATLPAGTTSSWVSTTGVGGANNTTAKINLFSTGKNEWIVSPKFLATNSTVLTFDAGLTDYNAATADPAGMTGTDDFVEVRISTDCGATFARIPAFAQFNAANQPSNGSLTNYSINLGAYAGQQIILGFFASEGTVDDTPDYDFHLDNINVNSPLPIDLTPVALVTPTATQACYSNAETVSVSVRNFGTQTLDFAVNPATVTAVVTTPSGSQTLTGTVSSGTLAPNALQTVTLTPTLNMAAVGTYSFAITATVTGDQVTSNDVLATVTRTVAAPVAGTVSTPINSLCISGTTTLTLTGAANGNIQWQQSTDNTTFTDISGATSATFTTPVLTSTTYFRAQVRCGTQTATSNVSTITVNNPLVTATNTPVSVCSGSTATLTATASTGANIRFFSTATGGTPLATTTPGTYTTPALTANTTYYAEAFTGSPSVAGLADNNASNGTYSQSTATDYPLGFAVTQAGILTSVDVYPTAAGALTIRLYSVSGSQPAGTSTAVAGSDVTITVTAAQVGTRVTVPLNYVLTPGDYKLSNFAGGLGRFSTYSGTYPLNSADGVLSVKGSYTFFSSTSYSNTTYNSFFNLTFTNECAAATRTAIQVNVTAPATASFPAATASTCGTSAYTLAGTVGGSATAGTYTTSGTGTFSPNATTLGATYTPSAADVAAGTVTITLTSTAVGTCPTATATLALSISPAPVASFSYPAATTYCAGSTSTVTPTLGTGATAGTFSSTSGLSIDPVSGIINLANSTAGTYTVTNTVAASGACAAATATATVTIAPATSAAFAYATGTFCASGSNPTPTVTGTAGGTFSSTTGLSINATTGAINLSASTVGTYTVTYTVAGACGTSATASVTITAAPVASFSYPTTTTYCAGSTSTVSPTLGTGASAGTFSSTTGLTIDATTGAINLATSTAGTYTVTNTIAASGSCTAATATATVTIAPATSAVFAYSGATFCATGTNPTPTVTGTAGGTFSSTTGLSINATTGAINLSASTPGTYTVTYTVTGGCGSSSTQSVTITSGQVATFSYGTTPTFCVSGTTAPAVVLGTGATAGTFSSTTGLTINATTGAITLSSSTPGTYTVTNTVAASGGCAAATATTTVTITAAPVATFSYATSAGCVGSTSAVTPTLGTGASAGTFSSTTGLTINATTGAINLATSTAGTYTVTNTVAAAGGCAAATATATFTVNPRPATPTITPAYNGSTTTLTSSAATGNQWYLGPNQVPGATGQTLVLTGLPAQLGSYTVTTTNANGCVSLPSAPLVVTSAKNGIAGASLRLYPNPTPNGQVTLELTGYRLATQLTVLDALGRVVASELLPANAGTATHALDLTGMATGVYMLRLSNTDGVETRRLVRE
ncbi:Ig-like domain-containing protein [Hymenobacter properus]|uniref:T9SS type A sorting domain-containing protein n=1 Tax=Hymenobacter properus TaxID=2791026 RepID=A0A931FM62_9BACT|nr:T9SS type A sorting domain-containing protein [Hymenobacter properus]MBF9142771.1 T9SS type A sorting domain-containing protein [Hymenobacter properus]MBR7721579.1 T9SS type A sorting domain-containing protein [Microvirga sp. SRT04]